MISSVSVGITNIPMMKSSCCITSAKDIKKEIIDPYSLLPYNGVDCNEFEDIILLGVSIRFHSSPPTLSSISYKDILLTISMDFGCGINPYIYEFWICTNNCL